MPSVSSSEAGLLAAGRSVFRTGRRAPVSSSAESGMVTAELALAMPALVLVLSLLLAVVGAASDLSRASDAARSAARAASIGTDAEAVREAALRLAPPGSDLSVRVSDGWVHVAVTVPQRTWGPVPLPAPTVTGAAPLEPQVAR